MQTLTELQQHTWEFWEVELSRMQSASIREKLQRLSSMQLKPNQKIIVEIMVNEKYMHQVVYENAAYNKKKSKNNPNTSNNMVLVSSHKNLCLQKYIHSNG